MKSRDPWTASDVATLRSMRDDGYMNTEIAVRLHRTASAISTKCKAIDLPLRARTTPIKHSQDVIEQVRAAFASGLGRRGVAALMGMSLGQISYLTGKHNLYTPAERESVAVPGVRAEHGPDPLPAFHPLTWEPIVLASQL